MAKPLQVLHSYSFPILFLYAGTVNDIWAILIPADFLILAIGCAFIILGVITLRRQRHIVSL